MNTALIPNASRDSTQHQNSPALLKLNATGLSGKTISSIMTAPTSVDDNNNNSRINNINSNNNNADNRNNSDDQNDEDDDDYSLSRFVPGTREYLFSGSNHAAFSTSYDAFFTDDGFNENSTTTTSTKEGKPIKSSIGTITGDEKIRGTGGETDDTALTMLDMGNGTDNRMDNGTMYERRMYLDCDPHNHQNQNRNQSLQQGQNQSQHQIQKQEQQQQQHLPQQNSHLEDTAFPEPTIFSDLYQDHHQNQNQKRHRQPSSHQQFVQPGTSLPKLFSLGQISSIYQLDKQQEQPPYHYQQPNNDRSRQEYAMDLDGVAERNVGEEGEDNQNGDDEEDDEDEDEDEEEDEHDICGKKRKVNAWKQQRGSTESCVDAGNDDSDKDYEQDENDSDNGDDRDDDIVEQSQHGGPKNKRRKKSINALSASRKISPKHGSSEVQSLQQSQYSAEAQRMSLAGQIHHVQHQYSQSPALSSPLTVSSSSSSSLSSAHSSVSASHCSNFITEQQFFLLAEDYLLSLSPKKREKALLSNSMYQKILMVLIQPKNTQVSTAQFRFWAKKMFTLSTTPTHHVVCHGGKPVATKECLYDVLVYCHRKSSHGGRDKTSAEVRQHYSWVPKELIARFVKHCPLCLSRRSTQQRQGSANGISISGSDLESSSSNGDQLQETNLHFPGQVLPHVSLHRASNQIENYSHEQQQSGHSDQGWNWQNQTRGCDDSDEDLHSMSIQAENYQDTFGIHVNNTQLHHESNDYSMQIDGEDDYDSIDSHNSPVSIEQGQGHFGLFGTTTTTTNIPNGMVGGPHDQQQQQYSTRHLPSTFPQYHGHQQQQHQQQQHHHHHSSQPKPITRIVPVAVHPNGHILHDRHPIHNRARLMGLASSPGSSLSMPMSMPMQLPMPMGRLNSVHNPFFLSASIQQQYPQQHQFNSGLGNHARIPGQLSLSVNNQDPGVHDISQISDEQEGYDVEDQDDDEQDRQDDEEEDEEEEEEENEKDDENLEEGI